MEARDLPPGSLFMSLGVLEFSEKPLALGSPVNRGNGSTFVTNPPVRISVTSATVTTIAPMGRMGRTEGYSLAL
jgi:hypothetical protein